MNRKAILLSAAAIVGALATPAQAKQGDVLIRVRGIMVAPNEKSGSVLPGFPGEKVSVDNAVTPEVDFTWMASDHIVVAVGRDYAEIAPVDGVVLGSGAQEMEVFVDVAPVEEG